MGLPVTAAWSLAWAFLFAFSGSRPSLAEEAIAYLSPAHGFWQVWVLAMDGSEPRRITRSAVEKSRCSWFPDRKSLLVNAQDGRLYRVDAQSGIEQELKIALSGMLDGVLSPDGRWVAFSLQRTGDGPRSGDGNDIWIAELGGGDVRRLAAMSGLQAEPSWSPDGRWIYFFSAGPGGPQLWRTSLDGADRQQITSDGARHFDAAVSGRGDLVFSSDAGGSYDLWIRRAQTREAVRLTQREGAEVRPSFSPDGERLVFESTEGERPNLWIVDARGSLPKRLTDHPLGARGPVWAPQGASR